MAASCDFEPKLLMESTYTCQRRMGEGRTGARSPPQAHSPPTFLLLLQPLQIRGVQRIPHEVSQPDEGFRNQGGESWSPEISERPPPRPPDPSVPLGSRPCALGCSFHLIPSKPILSAYLQRYENWGDGVERPKPSSPSALSLVG